MKVAIVHDELLRKGGAERVVISLHKLYPNADIFTIAYRPDNTFAYFKGCSIKTSYLNRIVKNEAWLMALFFPFGFWAVRSFDLHGYDLIILSSAHGAQYIRKPKTSIVVNYAHYVFRLIWEPESYGFLGSKWVRLLTSPIFVILRYLDGFFNVKADFTIFNSQKTRKKYLEVFPIISQDKCEIINPPIDLSGFYVADNQENFFLVVSRFEPYKKVDLVIECFKKIKDKLVIVGSGTMESELRKMAEGFDNISFETGVTDIRLKHLYASCRALIFPQVEDFGITPLECNASGRPVIAFRGGGVLETMIEDETAIFFDEQTADEIVEAVKKFKERSFDQERIARNVARFDEVVFHKKLRIAISHALSKT